MAQFKKTAVLVFSLLFSAKLATSLTFPMPASGNSVVGEVETITLAKARTIAEVGKDYDIGYVEMLAANPDLPRNAKIKAGTQVLIPAQFILPTERTGIVINLAELRLYYFPEDGNSVSTFPVAAGKKDWVTPLASTYVMNKKANPTWTVPDSIMQESIKKGKKLKPFYSATDPENPLGHHALYFDVPGLRMHGTRATYSIGRRASHGCLRLWDDDIEFLYNEVPVGTPVLINHVENKAGWQGDVLYLESNSPFTEYHDPKSVEREIALATQNQPATIDWQKVEEVVDYQEGMPVAIGSR